MSRGNDSTWVKVGGHGFETKVVDGVLWIRSLYSILGYLNHPSPFDSDGWMNTGDEVDVDGEPVTVGALADSVTAGSSTGLFWTLGGSATTAVITDDQGGTIVADATASRAVNVSPTVDTVYTLTVNGTEVATTTVTVIIPIIVTAAGVNEDGFFEVTVKDLEDGRTYDLFYSLDLVTWTPISVPQTADATGILTFTDSIAFDPITDPSFYYRVELAP